MALASRLGYSLRDFRFEVLCCSHISRRDRFGKNGFAGNTAGNTEETGMKRQGAGEHAGKGEPAGKLVGTWPPVAIVLGSDSDWPKVEPAAYALEEFGVRYSVSVMSAHRSPELVRDFASRAAERGVQVILAAAGGAAHLAGVIAAHTIVPVIGIPVPTELIGGLDSLLSMVQMPGDVPVATVGLGTGGARNAGLLAVQILALKDPDLQARLLRFKEELVEKVKSKDAALQARLGERVK